MLHHYHEASPGKPALVILHGLLGSCRNWRSMGPRLTDTYDVYALDLRNHGKSPHFDAMDYPDMLSDVEAWVDANLKDQKFYLLGHSMGGKLAMLYACTHPDRIKGLIIEDIVPRIYQASRVENIDALLAVDLVNIQSRGDADKALARFISEPSLRQFLLTNLVRTEKGFEWKVNLASIQAYRPAILGNPLNPSHHFDGKTIFIFGGASTFLASGDRALITQYFPNSKIISLKGAGHNVHTDTPDLFAEVLKRFAAS